MMSSWYMTYIKGYLIQIPFSYCLGVRGCHGAAKRKRCICRYKLITSLPHVPGNQLTAC